MPPRGVSREEKRRRLLELFHETSEFFTLKELEKIAPKQKGIIHQSVKEILDELVSEHLVSFDKIGTSNYYWSFPSAVGAAKQASLAKLVEEEAAVNAERRALLARLQAAQAEEAELAAQLRAAGDGDPVAYANKKRAVEIAKQAAQRWTDNTVTLMSFCKANGVQDAELRQMLEIDDEWDDLDITA